MRYITHSMGMRATDDSGIYYSVRVPACQRALPLTRWVELAHLAVCVIAAVCAARIEITRTAIGVQTVKLLVAWPVVI
jgi:hypothetical protein